MRTSKYWHRLVAIVSLCFVLALLQSQASARPVDLRSPVSSRLNFEEIYWFANLANDAYASSGNLRTRHPGLAWVATPGHTHVQYYIDWLPQRRIQIIAVRGTVDNTNWALDKDTHGQFDRKAGIFVHRGFDTVARVIFGDLKQRLRSDHKVYLTGHSLGGAVAGLLATYLDREGFNIGGIYTFGQPKFTDRAGARRYRHLPFLRVINQNDIVAMWPDTATGAKSSFAHVGPEVILLSGPHFAYLDQRAASRKSVGEFGRSFWQGSIPDHKMKWYLQSLRQKLGSTRIVSYRDRHRYIVHRKPGSFSRYPKVRKKYNFNTHHF